PRATAPAGADRWPGFLPRTARGPGRRHDAGSAARRHSAGGDWQGPGPAASADREPWPARRRPGPTAAKAGPPAPTAALAKDVPVLLQLRRESWPNGRPSPER